MNSTVMFKLDSEYLKKLALENHESYQQAKPFPHVVIDDFLPEFILDNILTEFPKAGDIDWQKFENKAEKKLANKHERNMGDHTRALLYQLNSSTFIEFLETLTGIKGIIPDPHFEGGGLHQIEKGGYLKMHVDFNRHTELNLDRRLNLLLYLNKDWQKEYGGYLELWDKEITKCEKKILPIFNRLVIFTTTDFTYHGHPEPLTCPEGWTRKSLALYYYTNGRPAEEISGKAHSTIFRARPGEEIQEKSSGIDLKTIVKKLTPPIFIDAVKLLSKK
ncbi:MAG: 2OG-Fe(II) oxygenase [Coleofasciculaceae cyanobacterium]